MSQAHITFENALQSINSNLGDIPVTDVQSSNLSNNDIRNVAKSYATKIIDNKQLTTNLKQKIQESSHISSIKKLMFMNLRSLISLHDKFANIDFEV